jgi:branched-chain amino acid transport system substrate-binding protein
MYSAAKQFSEETGKKPKTFALLYEGTDWGRSSAQYAKKFFPEMGCKLVLEESYVSGMSDFTPQILKMKATKPDLLIMASYTPDHILFNKQQMEQKLYLPCGLWSVGAGTEDPAFYKAVPQKAVEYMFVQDDWDITAPQKPWYPELNEKVKARLGYGLNAYTAVGYASMYLVKDVLERAGSSNRGKIRDAIAATDITGKGCKRIEKRSGGKVFCPALIRGISRIKFDEQGQNTFSHGMITQNQNGKKIPLYPVSSRPAGAKVTWPLPTWEER